MTVFAISNNALGYIGLGVVAIAIIVLLVSTFHPEGMKRPGGYLDGESPQADEIERDEHGKPLK
ncbi:hypothetical protein Q5424_10635 [Conexibacter sp. JD483]|uniref:hypothetical protein n=1 Tax=unclassified Conexibacter TaxID=2627773 RepID=UPI00271BF772|nr:MULTISPECIES: hypothetical protein [unclassified Conexibacter]MDO8187500.1 hypothetical protein [Conexibacter sp. CPCC 205706]MDO8199257.1 hypothetical protein [Conexibacter sp. CPCC 205762]MDR9369538.1 hypothetical protein [Conexibacter sp. JD483]